MPRHVVGMVALTVTLMATGLAWGDYVAGQEAWEAGRPAEAVAAWETAAAGGDRRAMTALGKAYRQGLGVPQDYVLAHMWFNLAASGGDEAALQERDELTAQMTPSAIAEAQERARERNTATAKADTQGSRSGTATSTGDPPPPRAIREAQTLLARMGYAPGPADGAWGRRSAQAYQTFLGDAGLPMTDVLAPGALLAMRQMAAGEGQDKQPEVAAAPVPADALHRAVTAGDVDGLETALRAGVDVNARDGRGWTALMHAADKGYLLLVPPLLEAKADPDMQAPDGATALFMAAVLGHSEIIELLMQAGADIGIRGPRGRTAVDVAQMTYGSVAETLERKENAAVFALLRGVPITTVEDQQLSAKQEFRDCESCPEMVVVPAGSFRMGSPPGEEYAADDETPQRLVTISAPFAIGKYEITFAEWDACVAVGGCNGYRPDDEGWGRGRQPILNVNREDAKAYLQWLSLLTGKPYRLLSEAEWEYAARAGTATPFHFGPTISPYQANYNGTRIKVGVTAPDPKFRAKPVLVGSFPANAFGLHDMHGNTFEWVEDCYHYDYRNAAPSAVARTIEGICKRHVARGGSWGSYPWLVRSASRDVFSANARSDLLGFRVARDLAP